MIGSTTPVEADTRFDIDKTIKKTQKEIKQISETQAQENIIEQLIELFTGDKEQKETQKLKKKLAKLKKQKAKIKQDEENELRRNQALNVQEMNRKSKTQSDVLKKQKEEAKKREEAEKAKKEAEEQAKKEAEAEEKAKKEAEEKAKKEAEEKKKTESSKKTSLPSSSGTNSSASSSQDVILSNGNSAGDIGMYAAKKMAESTGESVETWAYIIARESGGNPNARNASGASGLFQTMPFWGSTATVEDQIATALKAYKEAKAYYGNGLQPWAL